MTLTRPASGSTVNNEVTLCYEVSGTTREPDVQFEVTLKDGDTARFGPARIPGGVGRGAASADMRSVPSGTYDLRVQLVIDGSALRDAVITILDLHLRQDAPAVGC